MNKIYGAAGRQDGLYKVGRNKYEIIYGFGKDSDSEETGWNWRQRFDHLPTQAEIKQAIISAIKEESENRLRYGPVWRGITVEYSEMLKTDLIGILVGLQGGMMTLPQKINLGSNADGTPNTYVFESMEELADLSSLVGSHRSACSEQEWEAIKALGDLEEYRQVQ